MLQVSALVCPAYIAVLVSWVVAMVKWGVKCPMIIVSCGAELQGALMPTGQQHVYILLAMSLSSSLAQVGPDEAVVKTPVPHLHKCSGSVVASVDTQW